MLGVLAGALAAGLTVAPATAAQAAPKNAAVVQLPAGARLLFSGNLAQSVDAWTQPTKTTRLHVYSSPTVARACHLQGWIWVCDPAYIGCRDVFYNYMSVNRFGQELYSWGQSIYFCYNSSIGRVTYIDPSVTPWHETTGLGGATGWGFHDWSQAPVTDVSGTRWAFRAMSTGHWDWCPPRIWCWGSDSLTVGMYLYGDGRYDVYGW